jgi:hypothetical protein
MRLMVTVLGVAVSAILLPPVVVVSFLWRCIKAAWSCAEDYWE